MSCIHIDGRKLEVENPKTVLEASLEMGIYIPHLCFHPGLGTSRLLKTGNRVHQGKKEIVNDSESAYKGCGLCLVEIEGNDEMRHSCTTPVEDGMVVHTDTESVKEQRRQYLTTSGKTSPCLYNL